MTLELPKISIGDRVLKALGRKRAVCCKMNYEKLGHYAFFGARKESLLAALFASRDRELKPGWMYLEDLCSEIQQKKPVHG